jgi:hypothetical protein
MRWLVLGTALSAVAEPAPATEFMLSSTEVKNGNPMALARALTACKGKHLAGAILVGRAERHPKLRGDDVRSRCAWGWLVALDGVQYLGDGA